ncbi:AraC family transcriptional regulator [Chryseobacterium piperi]|uniref:AraC family transcriptional regulator n=1 Tax=Chryseobacterium piperi TaxID=558152 RepID=A0A086BK60_9FLAO|nr:AraC family transcriptional regulator [Chryseobacterium piperi]ASW76104.1 AraC family transcriptional regulator [Chryseobacterium piperi]KFF29324.1 AraC family transcriptional regulator [Chryseobacterium piperi]
MQNAKIKCGLIEEGKGLYNDAISKDAYVWYEKDWQHDDYEHIHERAQLTYVEEGYQYLHIEQKIYLVPKNHVIWIPSGVKHRTTSEAKTVNLMVILFKTVIRSDFFKDVHVFAAPPVLKEMLLYASKWNKLESEDGEQKLFLKALLNSLPNFCNESRFLEIPVPEDHRLIPVCDYVNNHYHENLNVGDMADLAKMSVRSLQRIFKEETGITLQKYGQLIRILKSVELIDTKQYTLSEIAFKVGYKSLSAFTSSYISIMKEGPKVKKNISF